MGIFKRPGGPGFLVGYEDACLNAEVQAQCCPTRRPCLWVSYVRMPSKMLIALTLDPGM